MNQQCKVCGEPAAGFHFGAFTCEGCKSFFGRTYNNLSSISECKNNGECVINKKNRTACKACRLRKCLMVGMSKSGSRYGRRSNWFKIHCLLQEQQQAAQQQAAAAAQRHHPLHPTAGGPVSASGSPPGSSAHQKTASPTPPSALLQPPHPADLAGFFASTFASSLGSINPYGYPPSLTQLQSLQSLDTRSSAASDSGTSSAEDEDRSSSVFNRLRSTDQNFFSRNAITKNNRFHPFSNGSHLFFGGDKRLTTNPLTSPSSDPGGSFLQEKRIKENNFPNLERVTTSWPNPSAIALTQNGIGMIDPNAWKDLWLRSTPAIADQAELQDQPIDLSVKSKQSDASKTTESEQEDECSGESDNDEEEEDSDKTNNNIHTTPLDLTLENKSNSDSETRVTEVII